MALGSQEVTAHHKKPGGWVGGCGCGCLCIFVLDPNHDNVHYEFAWHSSTLPLWPTVTNRGAFKAVCVCIAIISFGCIVVCATCTAKYCVCHEHARLFLPFKGWCWSDIVGVLVAQDNPNTKVIR